VLEKVKDRATAHAALYFLTRNFRDECWFWEMVIMCRKFLGIVIVVGLATNTVIQLQLLSLYLLVYMFLLERFRPFNSNYLLAAEHISCSATVITLNLVLCGYAAELDYSVPIDASVVMVQLMALVGLGVAFVLYIRSGLKPDDETLKSSLSMRNLREFSLMRRKNPKPVTNEDSHSINTDLARRIAFAETGASSATVPLHATQETGGATLSGGAADDEETSDSPQLLSQPLLAPEAGSSDADEEELRSKHGSKTLPHPHPSYVAPSESLGNHHQETLAGSQE
jgi:hypothetical protein